MRQITLKRSWLALLLLALVPLASACGSAVEQDDTRPEHERNWKPAELNQTVFLDPDELEDYVADGALVIDSRSPEDYAAGHYPGAVNTHGGKAWKDDNGILITDVVDAQQKVRDLGVDNDRAVVIYGNERSKRASRLFWTLEYFGHGQVYLVPESYEVLKTELEFDEETTAPSIEKGDFILAYRESVKATAEEVQKAIDDGNAVLIDTRRVDEYTGDDMRDNPRGGTIPGSTWYYWENIFDENNNLRGQSDLQTELEDLGLLAEDAVIVPYCETGTRSTYVYAVLRWLGRNDAQNYDGSWVEWSRTDYEIDKPDTPATDDAS
jgi:thiosulfate/3-mercaptopyruvate sulfurtransferase